MFQKSFFFTEVGEEINILNDGELSCAFFMSFLLVPFGLCDRIRATVKGIRKDLECAGWEEMGKEVRPRPGDVIIWDPSPSLSDAHQHVGLFLGAGKAISNSTALRTPQIHEWDCAPIAATYRNPKFS